MSSANAAANGDNHSNKSLMRRVREKRNAIDSYLDEATRRRHRLVHVTIIAGSVAAALTAAPALGGESFTGWLTDVLNTEDPSWRILCGIAALCSLSATIASQLHRSNNYDDHITRAQGAKANLEALEVGIESGYLNTRDAVNRYMTCIEDVPFLGGRKLARSNS